MSRIKSRNSLHARIAGRGLSYTRLSIPDRGKVFPFALSVILYFCITAGTPACAETPPAGRLMGLYLYNFLLFVDWPEDRFQDRHNMVIRLFGKWNENEFLAGIEGKEIRGRTIVIEHAKGIDEIETGCDVLFILNAEKAVASDLLARLRDTPCLTMSDMPGFARLGGMVEFLSIPPSNLPRQGTEAAQPAARFRINLKAVQDAGIKIRSRLLRLSEIVGGIPNGTPSER